MDSAFETLTRLPVQNAVPSDASSGAASYRRPTAVKLHRCSTKWKVGPCWRVQKALDEQGIDYEVVKGPARPGKRADLQRLSGQKLYPVIEFEDGSIYREESKDMAATIRAGRLDEKRGAVG